PVGAIIRPQCRRGGTRRELPPSSRLMMSHPAPATTCQTRSSPKHVTERQKSHIVRAPGTSFELAAVGVILNRCFQTTARRPKGRKQARPGELFDTLLWSLR